MLFALVHHDHRGLELGVWPDFVALLILALDNRLKQVFLIDLCDNASSNLTMGSDFSSLLMWLNFYNCGLAVISSILDKQRLK